VFECRRDVCVVTLRARAGRPINDVRAAVAAAVIGASPPISAWTSLDCEDDGFTLTSVCEVSEAIGEARSSAGFVWHCVRGLEGTHSEAAGDTSPHHAVEGDVFRFRTASN
jgi:hypothetical protein